MGALALDMLAVRFLRPPHNPVDTHPGEFGLVYRDVEFEVDDVTLRGWYLEPPTDAPPLPPVLLTHGWTGTSGQMLPVGVELALAGAPTLVWDVRGHGLSDPAKHVTARHFRDDILMATDILRIESGVGEVVLVGHSMGGAASALAAPRLTGVRGLVLIAAPADLMEVTARYMTDHGMPGGLLVPLMTPSWRLRAGESFDGLRPKAEIREFDGPVMVIHGTEDLRVPVGEGAELARLSGGDFLSVEGAAHKDVLERDELRDGLLRFLSGL
jgi:pimeloyl-ACP methyl ester carboxylesterase